MQELFVNLSLDVIWSGMKRFWSLTLLAVLIAVVGGILGSIITFRFLDLSITPYRSIDERQQLLLTRYGSDSSYQVPRGLDFRSASGAAVPAVVHVRVSYGPGRFSLNPLEFAYDQATRSSGSGVIITDDGYIVTNNHVIEDATNIEVVLNNNQRFYAKLIGADPSTDLALLKIKSTNLPFVRYGNSDMITPGEWVLAIGNPFDLNSTVTAGIVSAKARNIRVLEDRNNLQIESFIQTDAAVNPGNSGGALINLKGELIGINTAIATSTGGYSGYSFAIPVSLVRKVMDDLLEFGQVQRGLLGVQIWDVNANVADGLGLSVKQGVLVRRVNDGSAADESGIKVGDVIVAIEGHSVNTVSELQEWVARNRPGTEIKVELIRGDEKKAVNAKLKNNEGSVELTSKEYQRKVEGAIMEEVSFKQLAKLRIDGGVLVKHVTGGEWKKSGVRDGYVIAFIDKVSVDDMEDFHRIMEIKRGGVLLEGYYENGEKGVYALDW